MKENIEKILNDITQMSDELQVQINLGKAEAQDELERLGKEHADLTEKIKKLSEVTGDSAEELAAAAQLGIKANSKEDIDTTIQMAVEELKKGYSKAKELFRS